MLNIGLCFALLFTAAYRLPGGIAAVLGAIDPFLVAGLAYPLLRERPARRTLVAGVVGLVGVAFLVLRATVGLDPLGLAAAAGAMASMSLGTVLGRRWGTPDGYDQRRTAVLLGATARPIPRPTPARRVHGPPPGARHPWPDPRDHDPRVMMRPKCPTSLHDHQDHGGGADHGYERATGHPRGEARGNGG
jgi:hypothetical protein